jgi:hypothetical protein
MLSSTKDIFIHPKMVNAVLNIPFNDFYRTVFFALPWLTWHCIVGRVDDVTLFSGIPYVSQATDPDALKKQ